MPVTLCLFCGGDSSARDHAVKCDGRQGRLEASVPMLMSGLDESTLRTSTAAAVRVLESKDSQRMRVLEAIRAAGADGRTDDELQTQLQLDGSSERPRRWELWKLERIEIRRDARGQAIRRLTRTNRSAVVWITKGNQPWAC